jgi:hypothetical protein
VAEPVTLDDLAKPEYAKLLVVEDAATSSPGLAFLIGTIGAKGVAGYEEYWKQLFEGGAKVAKSISLVMEISEIYVDNYQKMLSDENYTPEELAAISSGYAMLIDESSDVLQDLKNVVNVTGMSLTDAERLAIIDNAYRSLLNYRNLVRYYTNKTISVSYLRARKKNDMDRVTALYGNPNEKYW